MRLCFESAPERAEVGRGTCLERKGKVGQFGSVVGVSSEKQLQEPVRAIETDRVKHEFFEGGVRCGGADHVSDEVPQRAAV